MPSLNLKNRCYAIPVSDFLPPPSALSNFRQKENRRGFSAGKRGGQIPRHSWNTLVWNHEHCLERCHQLQQQHCCRKMRCSVESWGSVMWFPSPSVSRSAIEGTWADRLAVRFTCVWKWTEQFLLALQKAVDSATFMIMAIGATQPKIQTNELSLSLSLCLWLNSVTCFVTLSADVLCACQHFYSVHYEVNVNCKM